MATKIPAWVDGVLTPVGKLDAHVKGLRHKAVSVFVIGPEGILLQQRAEGKYHTPGLWANTCCTHPHWDEAPETCAIRRLDEELGITGVAPKWRQQVEYRADVGDGLIEHEVVEIFVVTTMDAISVTPNPDEVQAVRWVTRGALLEELAHHPDRFTPWLHVYMTDHADGIFASGA
ncbi:isopentenyl-diphosphate delta-isomerase [Primorskyibacter aestuariivivens]|uniref:isopentenyl-diphosphate delta-isomerase n=1 Tax=Primorskyibacter aestuariivivens TaxID=1888912 RepID=UPI002301C032|nr:isopentenyl-diphosphate delta-isomerase [Primorskyibacter aestuariivivens]MDA7429276.1 isopentenyl-diphosphate delta-isomerase [Primorskyibacter aestuariivivens]